MTKTPTPRVRALVYERDGHTCVASHPAVMRGFMLCDSVLTLQHRIGRGSGGSRLPGINQPGNLITMCFTHNLLIERDATFKAYALSRGWSLPRLRKPALVPAEIPVMYPDGPYLVDDDGGRESIPLAFARELWEVFGLTRFGVAA